MQTAGPPKVTRTVEIIDILKLVRDRWKTFMLFVLLSTGLGTIYLLIAKPIYEASVSMSPVRLEKSPADDASGLVERLRRPLFYNATVLKSCGYDSVDTNAYQHFVTNRLTVSTQRNTQFIIISAQASSKELAEKCATAVAVAAIAYQDAAVQPIVDRLRAQFAVFQSHLSAVHEQNTRALDSLRRKRELDKKILDIRLAERAQYFEALKLELKNNEKASKDAESLLAASTHQDQDRSRLINQEFSAMALLVSVQRTLEQRLQELSQRADNIRTILQSGVAPNDGEIQQLRSRITEAEARLASGFADESLIKETQRLEMEENRVRHEIREMPFWQAQLTSPVFVSPQPIWPRRIPILGFAFLIGGISAFAYLFWRRSFV